MKKKQVPDYHRVIKNPMDFGTIRKKLQDMAYGSLDDFRDDVLQIFENAVRYNGKLSGPGRDAIDARAYFEDAFNARIDTAIADSGGRNATKKSRRT